MGVEMYDQLAWSSRLSLTSKAIEGHRRADRLVRARPDTVHRSDGRGSSAIVFFLCEQHVLSSTLCLWLALVLSFKTSYWQAMGMVWIGSGLGTLSYDFVGFCFSMYLVPNYQCYP